MLSHSIKDNENRKSWATKSCIICQGFEWDFIKHGRQVKAPPNNPMNFFDVSSRVSVAFIRRGYCAVLL